MNEKTRILIIEDDADLVAAMKKMLENKGHNVIVAYDSEEGNEKLKHDRPDLIILDLLLPRMPGVEVLKNLKATAPLQSIPVIVSSNLAEKNIIDECLRLGAADFIIKAHINLSELVIRIKKALN